MIGIALALLAPQLGLGAVWTGLIGASALAGIFIGGLVFGWMTDKVGRQTMYVADLIVFVVCSALQFFVEGPLAALRAQAHDGHSDRRGLRHRGGAALRVRAPPAAWRATRVPERCLDGRLRRRLHRRLLHAGHRSRGLALDAGEQRRPSGAGSVPQARHPRIPALAPEQGPRRRGAGRWSKSTYTPTPTSTTSLAEQATTPATAGSSRRGLRKRTAFAGLFWFCQVVPYFAIFTFLPTVLEGLGISGEFSSEVLLNLFLLAGAHRRGRDHGPAGAEDVRDRLVRRPRRDRVPRSASSPRRRLPVILILFSLFAFVIAAAADLESVYPARSSRPRSGPRGRDGAAPSAASAPRSAPSCCPRASRNSARARRCSPRHRHSGARLVISVAWAPETRHVTLLGGEHGQGADR